MVASESNVLDKPLPSPLTRSLAPIVLLVPSVRLAKLLGRPAASITNTPSGTPLRKFASRCSDALSAASPCRRSVISVTIASDPT